MTKGSQLIMINYKGGMQEGPKLQEAWRPLPVRLYSLKIVAAFRGMHVSPAKQSFGKCDNPKAGIITTFYEFACFAFSFYFFRQIKSNQINLFSKSIWHRENICTSYIQISYVSVHKQDIGSDASWIHKETKKITVNNLKTPMLLKYTSMLWRTRSYR